MSGHDEIRPQRSSETGAYFYSGADFGLEDISALLAELESYKVLKKTTIDTVPSCPSCQESNFNVSYMCPYSQHTMLEHGTLIEHYACGNADFEINYRSGPNELVCPKCRRTLKVIGTDYRKIERAYRCSSCGKSFGTPKLMLQCRSCNRKNDEEDLVMPPVYAYKINEQLRSELISHCSLESSITTFFEKVGFKVTAPTRMTGLSGVLHNFDLGAKKNDTEIVMDMISAIDEVGPPEVVEFFAKVYDTKPSKSLLIALPKLSREAQRLGAMYGVEVIGAVSPDEIATKLSAVIESLGITTGPNRQETLSLQETSTTEAERRDPPEVLKTSAPIETRAASLIEQTISSLEKKTSNAMPSVASNSTDELTRQARLRVEQPSQTRPPEAQSMDGDVILRRTREKMKHLLETS
jgi:Zn finger protein HypA/HybF involved in hydrogenase expression